jgi:ubiquinone/menaquinone biosynthesis C-methylase UbiE
MAHTDYDQYRDRYSDDLDRAVSFAGASHEFFTRAKAAELLRVAQLQLGDPRGIAALDVGCGIGLTDRHLAGRFRSLTGADVSPGVLEKAARDNPSVRYVLAERHRLPFEDGAFDLAFAVCVVQVVPPGDRPRFIAELARVTRLGGLVVIFEHNPYNPLTRLVVRRCEFDEDARMLGIAEAERLLRENGVTPIDRSFLLLFPSRRRRFLSVERALRRLPLGAQYYVAGRPA